MTDLKKKNLATVKNTLYRQTLIEAIQKKHPDIRVSDLLDYGLLVFMKREDALSDLTPEIILAEADLIMKTSMRRQKYETSK